MKNIPHPALQLDHPDACFYSVFVGENTISGYLESVVVGETITGQPWEVDFYFFIEACAENGVITDYERGRVYFDDGHEMDAKEWAEYWLDEFQSQSEWYGVLKDAIRAQFRADLERLERKSRELQGISGRTWKEVVASLPDVEELMKMADKI